MKKVIQLSVIIACIFLVSCKSAQQKENAAKQNVTAANQDLTDTRKENVDEWLQFKADSKIKIIENEERITELKVQMNKPGSTFDGLYRNRIEKLEVKNAELKSKLNTYDSNQTGWQTFKKDFNRDMDELGNNIKDLFR